MIRAKRQFIGDVVNTVERFGNDCIGIYEEKVSFDILSHARLEEAGTIFLGGGGVQ